LDDERPDIIKTENMILPLTSDDDIRQDKLNLMKEHVKQAIREADYQAAKIKPLKYARTAEQAKNDGDPNTQNIRLELQEVQHLINDLRKEIQPSSGGYRKRRTHRKRHTHRKRRSHRKRTHRSRK
jgi:hypothetical protein